MEKINKKYGQQPVIFFNLDGQHQAASPGKLDDFFEKQ